MIAPIPILTGDINPNIFNWDNGKIKLAYNCAYIQRGTLTPSTSKPF